MPGWSYQTIIPSRVRNDVTVPGLNNPVEWDKVVEGGMSLLIAVANYLHRSRKLKEIEPDIVELMTPGGGVLVGLSYCTSTSPTAYEGTLFQTASAIRGGSDWKRTYDEWMKRIAATGVIQQDCPTSWSQSDEYMWVTAR